jgi:hypothetical protein
MADAEIGQVLSDASRLIEAEARMKLDAVSRAQGNHILSNVCQ